MPFLGTFDIIRSLMFHIQSESNPIYRMERRAPFRSPVKFNVRFKLWREVGFVLLIISLFALAILDRLFFFGYGQAREGVLMTLMVATASVVSVSWTVPPAMLAGRSIIREKVMQTWDVLLTTPYSSEAILMAKAAAGVRPMWALFTVIASMARLVGVCILGLILLASSIDGDPHPVYAIMISLIAIGALIIEHRQEVALSVMLSVWICLRTNSQRNALIVGFTAGLLVRLVQVLLTIVLIRLMGASTPLGFSFLGLTMTNVAAGTMTLVAAFPTPLSLLLVAAIIVGREWVIRDIFVRAVRGVRG
jgi:hypothetical protein